MQTSSPPRVHPKLSSFGQLGPREKEQSPFVLKNCRAHGSLTSISSCPLQRSPHSTEERQTS
eukprot:jgi/Botrbrau1/1253/Bobra.0163s0046.1